MIKIKNSLARLFNLPGADCDCFENKEAEGALKEAAGFHNWSRRNRPGVKPAAALWKSCNELAWKHVWDFATKLKVLRAGDPKCYVEWKPNTVHLQKRTILITRPAEAAGRRVKDKENPGGFVWENCKILYFFIRPMMKYKALAARNCLHKNNVNVWESRRV